MLTKQDYEKYSKEATAASPMDSPYRHVGESLD